MALSVDLIEQVAASAALNLSEDELSRHGDMALASAGIDHSKHTHVCAVAGPHAEIIHSDLRMMVQRRIDAEIVLRENSGLQVHGRGLPSPWPHPPGTFEPNTQYTRTLHYLSQTA